MATFTLILAILTLIVLTGLAVNMALGYRTLDFLRASAPAAEPRPRVSVIIPALNEERSIEEALGSVLAQDYGNLEIIVINDRSTDRTGEILERMAAAHPGLRVIQIQELPEGWLGKNHALWRGALEAGGEILLFTDADIIMHPAAVSRAVGYLQRRGLDHVTAIPQMSGGNVLTHIQIYNFAIFFTFYLMPWRARNPRSRRFVGIGAFNMVRREAYLAAGGHQPIAMRPDDDVKLGKLLKSRGCCQDYLLGTGMLRVEWYATLRGMIHGLTKNAFAGVDYRIPAIVSATTLQATFFVWPFLGIVLTGGWARLFNTLACGVIYLMGRTIARRHEARSWYGLFTPFATAVFIYILWRSMVLTLLRGGIDWRGTHYALDKLRANRI